MDQFKEKYLICEKNRDICEGHKKLLIVWLKEVRGRGPKLICQTNNQLVQTNAMETNMNLELTSKLNFNKQSFSNKAR